MMVLKSVSVIACVDSCFGIGLNGAIPWNIKDDILRFKNLTTCAHHGRLNVIVMGRRTWESIGCKPLVGRLNVVLSTTMDVNVGGVTVLRSFDRFIDLIDTTWNGIVDKVFIIGGSVLYRTAMSSNRCDTVYLTMVNHVYNCDTFFPVDVLNQHYCNSYESKHFVNNGVSYQFTEFTRRCYIPNTDVDTSDELQYLAIVRNIMENGVSKSDRTGTGTLSCFGERMRFNLTNGRLPLLTTKRVFWRGIVEELLWFIRGDTNANHLSDVGVRIWDGNSSKEYFESIGLPDRAEGDLGPVYGFQWRHFGAKYIDMNTNYGEQGVDQLSDVIHKIKNDPNCRRIVMTAWNPLDLPKMALPPCHMFCQFYVENKRLSCQLYQRSADMGLGVPFNIASYSLLTHMIAHVTGLEAHELIHIIGDAHIYSNHIVALKTQLARNPRPFPTLKINRDVKSIDDFTSADFSVIGYRPHDSIPMKMSV